MKKLIFASCIVLALSSCKQSDKGDSAVSAEGNCTWDVVSAHNDIHRKASSYNTFKDKEYLVGVINACAQLKNLLGDRSCKAENSKSSAVEYISYAKSQSVCDQAAVLNK